MRWVLVTFILVGLAFSSDIHEDVQTLLKKVKTAPPEERYKVMNELKLKLRELNKREREEVIRKIYRELKGERHPDRERKGDKFEEEKLKHRDLSDKIGEKHKEKYEEKFEEKYEDKAEKRMDDKKKHDDD